MAIRASFPLSQDLSRAIKISRLSQIERLINLLGDQKMTFASRKLYKNKLNKMLGFADDESFLQMIWATYLLQSGKSGRAAQFLNFPTEAATTDFASKFAIRPWELEALMNELLAIPKKLQTKSYRGQRVLNCSEFSTMINLCNALRDLENASDLHALQRHSVMREMHRLAQRQFEWQRGFSSAIKLYRTSFIYGGCNASRFFESHHGIGLEKFTHACFALRALWLQAPWIRRTISLQAIEISGSEIEVVFSIISLPIKSARKMAANSRYGKTHIAYRKSIFRTYPCIDFGAESRGMCAPIPDLVLRRAALGVFYDVISGGGNIRNEVSARFEEYSGKFFQRIFPNDVIERNVRYKFKKNIIESPDLIVLRDGGIELAVECKATRLGYDAAYSENPIESSPRGYMELAKGVFQLWRFASHCRQGLVTGVRKEGKFVGLVLTLDPWLSMSGEMQKDVVERAEEFVKEKGIHLLTDDRIPVAFANIDDLETTYRTCSAETFLNAVAELAKQERWGWLLSSVHDEVIGDCVRHNTYPFEDEMEGVVPWWQYYAQRDKAARLKNGPGG